MANKVNALPLRGASLHVARTLKPRGFCTGTGEKSRNVYESCIVFAVSPSTPSTSLHS